MPYLSSLLPLMRTLSLFLPPPLFPSPKLFFYLSPTPTQGQPQGYYGYPQDQSGNSYDNNKGDSYGNSYDNDWHNHHHNKKHKKHPLYKWSEHRHRGNVYGDGSGYEPSDYDSDSTEVCISLRVCFVRLCMCVCLCLCKSECALTCGSRSRYVCVCVPTITRSTFCTSGASTATEGMSMGTVRVMSPRTTIPIAPRCVCERACVRVRVSALAFVLYVSVCGCCACVRWAREWSAKRRKGCISIGVCIASTHSYTQNTHKHAHTHTHTHTHTHSHHTGAEHVRQRVRNG